MPPNPAAKANKGPFAMLFSTKAAKSAAQSVGGPVRAKDIYDKPNQDLMTKRVQHYYPSPVTGVGSTQGADGRLPAPMATYLAQNGGYKHRVRTLPFRERHEYTAPLSIVFLGEVLGQFAVVPPEAYAGAKRLADRWIAQIKPALPMADKTTLEVAQSFDEATLNCLKLDPEQVTLLFHFLVYLMALPEQSWDHAFDARIDHALEMLRGSMPEDRSFLRLNRLLLEARSRCPVRPRARPAPTVVLTSSAFEWLVITVMASPLAMSAPSLRPLLVRLTAIVDRHPVPAKAAHHIHMTADLLLAHPLCGFDRAQDRDPFRDSSMPDQVLMIMNVGYEACGADLKDDLRVMGSLLKSSVQASPGGILPDVLIETFTYILNADVLKGLGIDIARERPVPAQDPSGLIMLPMPAERLPDEIVYPIQALLRLLDAQRLAIIRKLVKIGSFAVAVLRRNTPDTHFYEISKMLVVTPLTISEDSAQNSALQFLVKMQTEFMGWPWGWGMMMLHHEQIFGGMETEQVLFSDLMAYQQHGLGPLQKSPPVIPVAFPTQLLAPAGNDASQRLPAAMPV
ncbi:hypothetical protein CXG81DRAFT_16938 [Caulochytrium protostelioides]|uniref:Uncharacterized protein n=1 Tax=Caulochytrium protostelioides TaxID=1555241 RepID=A0A4P9XEH6_9FUNG|nr:hypothetical protein CXG81DRAFT_16938 [Caulochytrium protostelioides]|eukprot:RKP03561.1 hypothetical protein CXG81DRAFT_16938 [Caulochytrium protostelioides]